LFAGSLVTVIAITYFIVGLGGGSLPGQEFISYWLNVWYFAWIGAPLAIVVNIVVSLLTTPPPLEIRKFLAEQVHN
jgi:cation/acetate symporter